MAIATLRSSEAPDSPLAIHRWQRSWAEHHISSTARKGGTLGLGAICFPQRFGGSVNLNVHYHVIVPDVVFNLDDGAGAAVSIEDPAPTPLDIEEI